MGTIPGPIITFRLNSPDLASATRSAMDQVRAQAKSTSDAIAADWQRMSAQIRASVATEKLDIGGIATARGKIVNVLETEIGLLRSKDALNKQELSSLKAMTLEIERQKSALAGTGGLTAGTQAFISKIGGLFSQQTAHLGSALFGVQGGSQLESLAAGGIASSIAEITEAASPATLAIAGITAGFVALGTIAGTVTINMLDTAQAINNMSAATGLSTKQVQEYTELAKEMDLDASALTNSFSRLQVQLGEYITKGKSADESTQAFVKVTSELGVSLINTGGTLRPINNIIGDLSNALRDIPDQATRTALTMEALGVRGKVLAEAMNTAAIQGRSLQSILNEIGQSGVVIPDAQLAQLQKAKTQWDELTRSVRGYWTELKEAIATGTLSVLGGPGLAYGKAGTGNTGPDTGIGLSSLFSTAGAPGSPSAPSPVDAFKQIAQYAQEVNALLLHQAEVIKAGGQAQFELVDAEKKYNEAVKEGNGDLAKQLATKIESLKNQKDLNEQYAATNKWLTEIIAKETSGGDHARRPPQTLDQVLSSILNPANNTAPQGGLPGNIGGISPSLFAAANAKPNVDIDAFLKQINQEHEDLFQTQRQKDAEHYQDELEALKKANDQGLLTQKEYLAEKNLIEQDANKTLLDANKKYADEAGKLFDDLVGGKGRSFLKDLHKDIENILLAPAKNIFSTVFGGALGGLNQGAQGSAGGFFGLLQSIFPGLRVPGAPPPPASGGFNIQGILNAFGLGGLLGQNAPGGTPGFLPGGLGLGGQSGKPFAVQTMLVQAGFVAVSGGAGGLGGTGGGLGIPGLGGLLSGGGGTLGIGNLPFTPQGLSNANALSSFNTGGIGGGGGGGGFGLGATGSSGAFGGGALGGPASIAAQVGGGLLLGLGSRTGGIAGGAEGAAGGAIEGAIAGLAAGPIGAAIGAVVGGIGGLIAGLLGGPSFQQQVQRAMENQQYHAPPRETFSFASNGSIGSTLSTGFAQSGNSFSQYALPANTSFQANALIGKLTAAQQQLLIEEGYGLNSNQPFLGFPTTPDPYEGQGPLGNKATGSNVSVNINLPGLIDPTSASAVFTQHAELISRLVSNSLPRSSSAFGGNVRRAVNLP